MDQKFWAHFDAVRRSVEQATSSTSMAKLASSLEVARRLTSSLDFETVSSALAARGAASPRFRATEALTRRSSVRRSRPPWHGLQALWT